jgi:superfamily II helicase
MLGVRKKIEEKTVYSMIELYCHHYHGKREGLCQSCLDLYEYTVFKYEHCPFGNDKPVCSKCKVHCYNKNRREEIREVMRFSGPRMLFKHPFKTIFYFIHKIIVPAHDLNTVRSR